MLFDGIFTDNQQIKTLTLADFLIADPTKRPFLIISYGMGNDSTALLIRLQKLGIRPEIILFADTGAERQRTYNYLPVINHWLRSVGFPEVTVINAGRNRDRTIEAHCFRLGIFAALSYGKHNCSVIWKIEAARKFLKTHCPVIEARKAGRTIARMVGFHKGEEYRAARADENAVQTTTGEDGCKRTTAFATCPDDDSITMFPLIEEGIDFVGVLNTIWEAGLKIPGKSSCHFCGAMTQAEIEELAADEPHLFFRSLVLERVVQRNEIVKAGRVQGIAFGKPWGDMAIAAPYLNRLDEVIEFFGLDRAVEDGKSNPKNEEWRPKAARVELFIEAISSVEKLRAFMNNETDMSFYALQLAEIRATTTAAQMALAF